MFGSGTVDKIPDTATVGYVQHVTGDRIGVKVHCGSVVET